MTNHKPRAHTSPSRSAQPALLKHRLLIVVLAILQLAIIATAAPANSAIAPPSRAHTARTLNATDTAKLHYIKHSGSELLEEGAAQGALPGSMHARCNLGATFTASFTIFTHGGTITGHGTATPHGSGLDESFAGTLTITGGTGRYAHAHGHARLSGTFNRRTYAIVLKTTGSLSY